ncbi:helix-turn-helix domain-containing protein [Micromonospora sp. NPDC005206]|uniref:helix-turn-helix domain-containing protein n=1 Tax=Micromonospora sp. NPDC005206 TaxID=3157022 RepID=UPI0033B67ECA
MTESGPDPDPVFRRSRQPAEAAALLRVPESWLRRYAARRQIPRTLLGKHLRFSAADFTRDHHRRRATRHRTPPHPSTTAPHQRLATTVKSRVHRQAGATGSGRRSGRSRPRRRASARTFARYGGLPRRSL